VVVFFFGSVFFNLKTPEKKTKNTTHPSKKDGNTRIQEGSGESALQFLYFQGHISCEISGVAIARPCEQ